jgi:hypothetical protein
VLLTCHYDVVQVFPAYRADQASFATSMSRSKTRPPTSRMPCCGASTNVAWRVSRPISFCPTDAWLRSLPADIKEIYPGSINVRLDQSLQITSYDYTTLPIPWWDVDATHPGRWVSEIFSFVEIKFEYPQGGTPRRAWIFDCHNSAYFR